MLLIIILLYSLTIQGAEGKNPTSTARVGGLSADEPGSVNTNIIRTRTYISDAPLNPANTRIITVAKDGSGNYTSILSALKASQPGDTIRVKNGIYKESVNFTKNGTQTKPIALVNYPSHSPVIDPGGGSYTPEVSKRVTINASWIIIDGFEIRYGHDGIKVYKPHVTIRDNYIHHNKYQGILVVSAGNVLIEGNTIEWNGTDPNTCTSSNWGGFSPKHCHAIYMSDYKCVGMPNITISRNILGNQGGRGILWSTQTCSASGGFYNNLVENNVIENNSTALGLFSRVFDSVIRNNTIVARSYPSTDDPNHYFVRLSNSKGNIFKNNTFYTTLSDMRTIEGNSSNSDQNTFDYNIWHVVADNWRWKGTNRSDFKTNYKSVTAWDQNGQCCEVDPKLASDYGIASTSPARNTGTNAECPEYDKDGFERPQEGTCDIGMFEYVP